MSAVGQVSLFVLAVGVLTAVALHVAAGFHYPVPWDDEAHFLIPAQNFAQHLELAAPQLNAPQGIFWMPDGYAVVLSAVFAVVPNTEAVARLMSLGFTLVFAACLFVAATRLGGARLFVAGALATWLVAPQVVLMANTARMEALILAVVGVALLLVAVGSWSAALSVVSLTPLIHPMGLMLVAALVLAGVLLRADLRPSRRAEFALIALAGLAWTLEAVWFVAHLELVRSHIGFQLARKASKPSYELMPTRYELVAGLAAVGGLAGAVLCRRRFGERQVAFLVSMCAVAGGFIAIRVAGNELWYSVLSRETVLLLVALAVAIASPRRPSTGHQHFLGTALPAALALVCVAVIAQVTVRGSTYGMSLTASTADRDRAFLETVTRELRAFDNRQSRPVLVALDWSSGLTPFLLQERWRNLHFIDPTPVTPLTRPPDYVLFSVHPAEPDWRRHIENRLPEAKPVLHVVFPGSTGQLSVYPGDLVDLPIG
jgi:hypothetical protein